MSPETPGGMYNTRVASGLHHRDLPDASRGTKYCRERPIQYKRLRCAVLSFAANQW